MKPEDTVPAVRRIASDRADAFGFDLVGQIKGSDIENMYGLLEGAYEENAKLDLMIRMIDCDGFDRGVFLKDTTFAMQTHSLKHLRKCAIVGGPTWIAGATALLSPFLSMKVKHFPADSEEKAWQWIGATPV